MSSFAFSPPLGILSLLQPGYTSVLSPGFSIQRCNRPPRKTRLRPHLQGLPSPTPGRNLGSISLLQDCGAEWGGAAQPLPSPAPCSAIIHRPLSLLPALWMAGVLGGRVERPDASAHFPHFHADPCLPLVISMHTVWVLFSLSSDLTEYNRYPAIKDVGRLNLIGSNYGLAYSCACFCRTRH